MDESKDIKGLLMDSIRNFRKGCKIHFYNVVKILLSKEGQTTLIYLLVTLFFLFIPYLTKVTISLMVDDKHSISIDLYDDFKNGSIIYIAISLLAPIWYTLHVAIVNDYQNKESIPTTETFVMIIICLLIYLICFIFDLLGYYLSSFVIMLLSIVLLLISSILAFKTHIYEISDVRNPDDVRKNDQDKIEEKLYSNYNSEATVPKGKVGKLDELNEAIENFDLDEDEDDE